MALFWAMKNLVGGATWDKEAMDEATECMYHWQVVVTSYINHLNIKVDMIMKRLVVMVPPPLHHDPILKPMDESSW